MEAFATLLRFYSICFFINVESVDFKNSLKRNQELEASFSYFKRHELRKLSSPSHSKIAIKREDSLMKCAFTCTRLPWCLSFNFQRSANEDGQHLCEALSSEKYNNSQDYQGSVEFDHFSLVVFPCSRNPCLNGGTCVALYENDFTCVCAANYTGKQCEDVKYPTSCRERYERFGERINKAYLLNMETGKTSIFCHMTDISGCGGGGWTLVMKIDGSKSNFSYSSSYWSNKETFNLPGGTTGIDHQQTKLPSYWSTRFTKICLGMRVGSNDRFILLRKQASSLYSLVADGKFRSTSLGRKKWKSLITGSSLQIHCGKEGFNINITGKSNMVRIGIIGNNEPECDSPDSFLGFGSAMQRFWCGNVALLYSDNGDKQIQANGYIFVQ